MSNNSPPSHTLRAKLKTRDGSKAPAIKIASAWPNQFGGHNVRFEGPYKDRPGVVAILLSDGTQLPVSGYWFEFRDEEAARASYARRDAKEAGAVVEQVQNGGGNADDDIPF